MKNVTTINSASRLPDWPAAAASMRRGASVEEAIAALFGVVAATPEERHTAIFSELAAQRSPAISIYDRRYTAHIYPEPDVSDGQVYEALRDYAAQHATPDPAMVEIKRFQLIKLLDEWAEDGPPSADDVGFWRQFEADLARAKRGADSPAVVELEQRVAELESLLAAERERADALSKALRSAEGVD